MLSGARVQIIASVAHWLVVERSCIFKTLIHASLQIVQYYIGILAIHPMFPYDLTIKGGTHFTQELCKRIIEVVKKGFEK